MKGLYMEEIIKKLVAEVFRQLKRIIFLYEDLSFNRLFDSFNQVESNFFIRYKFDIYIHETEFDAGNFDALQHFSVFIQGHQ